MEITLRTVEVQDYPVLAAMNQRLIEDEGGRNPMDRQGLEERLAGWLARSWRATIFLLDDKPVGYAVYRFERDEYFPDARRVSLRQFFVAHEYRTQGVGTRVFARLREDFFPAGASIRVQALESNPGAHAFWARLGFQPYLTTYQLGRPPDKPRPAESPITKTSAESKVEPKSPASPRPLAPPAPVTPLGGVRSDPPPAVESPSPFSPDERATHSPSVLPPDTDRLSNDDAT